MTDGHAVRGAKAGEIVTLHDAGETFADRRAGHIDELAGDEVARRELGPGRSEEHTSELQSLMRISYAVFCLKKKKIKKKQTQHDRTNKHQRETIPNKYIK